MIYAPAPKEIEARRKAFICKWWLKCRAVADSLEEAGEQLFVSRTITLTASANSSTSPARTSVTESA